MALYIADKTLANLTPCDPVAFDTQALPC